MMIIGCDFHPRFQQIAFVDQETGEYGERRLSHRRRRSDSIGTGWQAGADWCRGHGELSLVPALVGRTGS